MEMFNFVLDSFKRGIFDFKVKRQDLIAGTVVPAKIISILVSLWLATLILYRQQKTNQTIISTDRKFRRQNTSVLAKLGNGDIVRQFIMNHFNANPILSDVFVVLKRII